MRIPLKELLENLGVRHILSPYQTNPWVHYDDDQGITCSAEVRMGPGGDLIEAEIQFLFDDPPEAEEEEEEGKGGDESASGPKRKMYLRAKPAAKDLWSPAALNVEGKDYTNEIGEWEKKGCALFKACVQSMQMGELPDMEELIKRELSDDSFGGRGGSGKIGRKSPKVKPGQLLGMKKGGM